MADGRPYVALGNVMDEQARRRNVRGPHRIANHIRAKTGEGPTGVAVAKWMYGDASPKNESVELFADAFELTEKERAVLAYANTFRGPAAA